MDKKMSFSAEIKDRLTEQKSECDFCTTARLAGFMRFAASFGSGDAVISTENKKIADCAGALIKECFGVNAEYDYNKQSKRYKSILKNNEQDLLCAELMADQSAEQLMPFACCKRAFLSGAFLGGGSVNDPQKSYHLEFDTKTKAYAEDVLSVLEEEGIKAKLTSRKGRYVVYIKDYESIAAVLGLIGAGYAALELYNISVEKEIRNDVNRQVNCDNANMKKQGKAASEHLHAIAVIEKKIGLGALSEVLREMAEVRRAYPDDSIQELGEKLNPPIGKSGVNHRLKRLMEIASEL
ncbi:MAG: DNA-binding protein WhiA [Eubacteriales bacterium]|nr:DNA-binding protein WhiA [Eubacteriales bacterium]